MAKQTKTIYALLIIIGILGVLLYYNVNGGLFAVTSPTSILSFSTESQCLGVKNSSSNLECNLGCFQVTNTVRDCLIANNYSLPANRVNQFYLFQNADETCKQVWDNRREPEGTGYWNSWYNCIPEIKQIVDTPVDNNNSNGSGNTGDTTQDNFFKKYWVLLLIGGGILILFLTKKR